MAVSPASAGATAVQHHKGIVAKRLDAPYRAGKQLIWVKDQEPGIFAPRCRGGRARVKPSRSHIRWERDADGLITLPAAPDLGTGGEVVRASPLPDIDVGKLPADNRERRLAIRDTLAEGATRIAEDVSIQRTDLLLQPNIDAVAMGIDPSGPAGISMRGRTIYVAIGQGDTVVRGAPRDGDSKPEPVFAHFQFDPGHSV